MTTLRFAKYHGIGNDFVMIADPADDMTLDAGLVRRLCDRRFGIGGDGVIRVAPGRDGADLFMDYVNSDGSVGEMCGNGIRCVALFARAEGLTDRERLRVGTRAGVKVVDVDGETVRVDMGPPILDPWNIPVSWDGMYALHLKVESSLGIQEVACLSMGNPHAVLFVDDPATAPVDSLGPELEHHPLFPNGTNVEFAAVRNRDRVDMRVWERGSGETLACGTGACAVAVAARLLQGTNEDTTVALPGGELLVSWGGSLEREAPVYLTGPAVKSFEGEVDLDARS